MLPPSAPGQPCVLQPGPGAWTAPPPWRQHALCAHAPWRQLQPAWQRGLSPRQQREPQPWHCEPPQQLQLWPHDGHAWPHLRQPWPRQQPPYLQALWRRQRPWRQRAQHEPSRQRPIWRLAAQRCAQLLPCRQPPSLLRLPACPQAPLLPPQPWQQRAQREPCQLRPIWQLATRHCAQPWPCQQPSSLLRRPLCQRAPWRRQQPWQQRVPHEPCRLQPICQLEARSCACRPPPWLRRRPPCRQAPWQQQQPSQPRAQRDPSRQLPIWRPATPRCARPWLYRPPPWLRRRPPCRQAPWQQQQPSQPRAQRDPSRQLPIWRPAARHCAYRRLPWRQRQPPYRQALWQWQQPWRQRAQPRPLRLPPIWQPAVPRSALP